ncbi:ATP-binding protein [Kistimonas scapharcae]|uniref:ATP-binding protein n=1 Tax=Kistimonas scapharcae TaxID=1036133 RepID=A0ABP8V684_9GAMM
MEPLGLISISLCNSYIRGKIVEILVDDHTNLSGGNGKGKTSALQLIPCFYGHSPEKLVSTAAGKSSFIDFYLPSQSSMIVFHYRRGDGDRTVVMLRHPSQKIIYRFISTSPLESLFQPDWMDKIKSGSSAHELLNDLKISNEKFNVSRIIENITDYRSIIQNDRKLRQASGKRQLIALAWEYSLGGSDTSSVCQDMDYLTYAILKRSNMIDRLKMMIINTQFDSVVPTLPHHNDDNSLISNIRSIRDFEESKVESIRQAIDSYHALDVDRKSIQGYQMFLSTALPDIKEQRETIIAQQSVLEEEYQSFVEMTGRELADLEHDEKKMQRTVNLLDTEINALLDEQNKWADEDIQAKIAQVEQLPSYKEAAKAARTYLESLSEEQVSIEDWKREQIERVTALCEKSEKDILRSISSQQDVKKKLESEKESKLHQIERALNDALNVLKDEHYQNEVSLRERIFGIRVLIDTRASTEGERRQEEQAQQDFQERKTEFEQANSCFATLRGEIDQLESDFREIHIELDQARTATQIQEKHIETLRKTLFPEKNTLLSHLRLNKPDWVNNIGRLIQPEILSRTDLAPTQHEQLGDDLDFYGLSLELDHLQKVDAARDEDDLRSTLEAAEEKLQSLQTQEDKIGVSATDQDKKIKSLKRKLVSLKAERDQAEQRMISARDGIAVVKSEIQTAINSRDQEYRHELGQFEKSLRDLKKTYENRIDNEKSVAQEEKDEFISLIASKISDIDDRIGSLQLEREKVLEDKKASVRQIELDYKLRCKKAGVDDETLSAAGRSLREKEECIKLTESYQETLSIYDNWLQKEWSQYDKWAEELITAKKELAATTTKIKNLADTKKAHYESYTSTAKKLSNQLNRQNSHLKVIADVLEQVPVDVNSRVKQPSGLRLDNIEAIVSDLEALINRYRKLRRELINSTRAIHSMILNRDGSQLTEYWVNRSSELLTKMQLVHPDLNEDSDPYLLELLPNLEKLIEGQLPSLRDALITSTELAMSRINDYIENLQLIDSEAKRITRRLHSSLNVGQRIPALSDIRIVLSSKIHEMDGWHDFERFRRIYDKNHIPQTRSLPTVELERELENILVITRTATNKKQELKNLIVMTLSMVENGRAIDIRNDKDFNDASSNGLSYLAVIVIFRALARYLCPEQRIRLAWPVDEIGTLDASNLSLLFEMLHESNITMIGAVPTTDPVTLRHFTYKWIIDRDRGIKAFQSTKRSIDQAVDRIRAHSNTEPKDGVAEPQYEEVL